MSPTYLHPAHYQGEFPVGLDVSISSSYFCLASKFTLSILTEHAHRASPSTVHRQLSAGQLSANN
uniref:Uncharacterized protein n=1 Tax=Romanomermis culicivorax TaxID=13658 RepID=A0A915JKW2_ROMCU